MASLYKELALLHTARNNVTLNSHGFMLIALRIAVDNQPTQPWIQLHDAKNYKKQLTFTSRRLSTIFNHKVPIRTVILKGPPKAFIWEEVLENCGWFVRSLISINHVCNSETV